jgi:hypothetical protein
VMAPWEIMLCSWVFQFAEPQIHDHGLDGLPFWLSNSTFHDFKLCCGSTWILFKKWKKRIARVYNQILKYPNNECIDYKVEHGNSIQEHILRVYVMKYSNLGVNNECIELVLHKVECGGK